uniref:Uncharacterized protein n=1 Tax=Chromera velia CCMP2878 TaxID=1169474 RepID=A0A0G4EYI4_9ALVE|eukprot:Cvel_14216.t1-p1 / transcript=Cvel_14216.t1 / gene=Cvel_14216 / organism=Chromera_velia_CCMP2878 / gene_product=hypothetical protein / transcript_product=hypothetical protein / location=Cvel_scaffold1002:51551-51946(-) / protein_length=132 / sequence_SO=supercontig / SO=protein_coding / is_pseudo=false
MSSFAELIGFDLLTCEDEMVMYYGKTPLIRNDLSRGSTSSAWFQDSTGTLQHWSTYFHFPALGTAVKVDYGGGTGTSSKSMLGRLSAVSGSGREKTGQISNEYGDKVSWSRCELPDRSEGLTQIGRGPASLF